MPIMEWQEKFNLGMEPCDAHHQHLVMLLNTAYDQYVGKTTVAEFGTVLAELLDYATYHFEAEEQWMSEKKYGKLDEHVEMHNRFITRVIEMQEDLFEKNNNVPLDVLTFLASWLSSHILVADAEIAELSRAGAETSNKPGIEEAHK